MAKAAPDLSVHGFRNLGEVYYNLSRAALYEHTLNRGEGFLSSHGALMCDTGKTTGRMPKDRFIVDQPAIHDNIDWNAINQATDEATWEKRYKQVQDYLDGKDVFVQDVFAGAEKQYRLGVRVISEKPFQALFTQNRFISLDQAKDPQEHKADWVVVCVPFCKAEDRDTGVHVLLNFEKQMILVLGSDYAGEIKKGIFTVLNYLNPMRGVMSMHCSANYGADRDDTALFFGLSGTGKTTLSADPSRTLIGDDEHGWSDDGVFNFEGGCYAKVIRLDPQGEPEIYQTTRRFGTILENVIFDNETRRVDLDDGTHTENTRSSYPITHIDNADPEGYGHHPRNIMFLTADAFGVLPPISKLTKEQAMYHFLSGYTAKVAGTERGVTEPQPNFSACFGAPFMPLHPGEYAKLLGEKIEKYGSTVWLVNTGWTGGPAGEGSRMKLAYTRRMVTAALNGELDDVETVTEPNFGLSIPTKVEGVPPEVLNPRSTWKDGAAYDAQAKKLVGMFINNFKQFEDGVTEDIKAAGPKPQ
ncbi:MAG: phosphoenolpyruvate carboxykinase (ATP) [Anaerolineales bacterium]|nr:phosphoenolpyruvate carboxykinase (ATP) [Anaerolineales bacterium]